MAETSDPTFRSYQASQAKLYAEHRLSYSVRLYNHILGFHAKTGGKFGTLFDVGCGPGNATRDMSPAFEAAVGVDPGAEMINSARDLGAKTKTGDAVRFEVCAAEVCASVPGVKEGEVDLLISAMAAHWFDMPKFWQQAAKLVKPGGTVAIWTLASNYAHPDTPNYEQVNRILLHFERETLAPFETPGNRVSRDMYDNLTLPWTADPQQTAFPRDCFHKDEWDRDGILSNGQDFFGDTSEATLERMERGLGTASMVTRWREAHANLVGTEKDCVKQLIEELRPLVGEKGFRSCGSTAILFFKRA